MAVTEVRIGTKFGVEDCKVDFTSALKKTIRDMLDLSLLCEFEESEDFQISPSRRNDILLQCASVIVDLTHCLKGAHGEQPNSTIPIDPEELEKFHDVNGQINALSLALVVVYHAYGCIVEADLEDVAKACLLSINFICLIPAMLGEADLEQYILECINEYNK